jgi:hypothetical protein
VSGVPIAADVVDQDVERGDLGEDFGSEASHLRLRRQVGDEDVHGSTPSDLDLARGGEDTRAVSASDGDVGS